MSDVPFFLSSKLCLGFNLLTMPTVPHGVTSVMDIFISGRIPFESGFYSYCVKLTTGFQERKLSFLISLVQAPKTHPKDLILVKLKLVEDTLQY